MIDWTTDQLSLFNLPFDLTISLTGPAGVGKTSAAASRLLQMMDSGISGNNILILAPHRNLLSPYEQALRQPTSAQGGRPTLLTYGGLAQRMVRLFWPLAAKSAGFGCPTNSPVFLTLETAQYCLAHLIRPLIEEHHLFDSVTMDRNRLYSQILDNLNKSAIVGFSYKEIGDRLKSAWIGQPAQLRVYDDVQTCISIFRAYCLENNLLDFSLQVDIFRDHLWSKSECHHYLLSTYRHLIYENIEEDPPAAHDLIREWLPELESALLILDEMAGYRRFLGADPISAINLIESCGNHINFRESLIQSINIRFLGSELEAALTIPGEQHFLFRQDRTESQTQIPFDPVIDPFIEESLHFQSFHFYPEMIDWAAETIYSLIHEHGIPAHEIVILAPFMSDSLRFSIVERLEKFKIPVRSHRPSRALREEPATECLLNLAALANPKWEIRPSRFDVAYTLLQAIDGLDLVRAQLLAEIVYHPKSEGFWLTSFESIQAPMQERITYVIGERFEKLRVWLKDASDQDAELDIFLSRLFGEVLSQQGFGFHVNYDAGHAAARLIESIQKFRWIAGPLLAEQKIPIGKEYLLMVQEGVIAAEYLGGWRDEIKDAVLLAPAYTFLLENRPVEVQFWLDAGSRSWTERLLQPLTHPYVLSRGWPNGRIWSDADEFATSREATRRLVLGLLARCKRSLFLGFTQLGEQGYEQRGPLLTAFQRILRNISKLSDQGSIGESEG